MMLSRIEEKSLFRFYAPDVNTLECRSQSSWKSMDDLFSCMVFIIVSDFNEITPSKLLRNNIKVKEKFCVVLVHSHAHL
jgi:hypothetical protein